MREINFFAPYIVTKKPNGVGRTQAIIAFVLMVTLCAGYYGWNFYRIMKYGVEIISYETFLNNPANIAAAKNFTDTKQKLDIINLYSQGLVAIEEEFSKRGLIGSEYIKKLNSAIPHAVTLESINISSEDLAISGVGTNRNAVAEYQHNLSKLGIFDDVFVSILSKESEDASGIKFSLHCRLREVTINEAK